MSEISPAEKAHAEYLDTVASAKQKAIAVYPDLFASKKDYTPENQKKVERMYRNGYGVPLSVAFESTMGYPYDIHVELEDQPAVTLDAKPPEYLGLIERIFEQPIPTLGKKYYSTLRTIRRKLGPLRASVELGRLKSQYSNQEAEELQLFIDSRLEDVQKLLPS